MLNVHKGLVGITGGNAIASIIGAVFWIILITFVSSEEYGLLTYYITIASISSVATTLGLNTAVTAFLARGDNKDFLHSANLIVLLTNVISFIIIFLIIRNPFAALLSLSMSLFTMSIAEILGEKKYKRYFFVMLLQRSLQIILALLLFFIMGLDGVLIGYIISILTFSYLYYRSVGKMKFSFNVSKQKLRFSFHSYTLSLSQSLTLNIDKLLVGPLFGFVILGLYQVGFQFLMMLSVIPISLFQFLISQGKTQRSRMGYIRLGLVVATASFLIVYILTPMIMSSLFPKFLDAIESSRIMIIGIFPMTINSILTSDLLSKEQSKQVMLAAIVYISSLLVLVSSLGSSLGLIGLSISMVISLAIQSGTLVVLTKVNKNSPRLGQDSLNE